MASMSRRLFLIRKTLRPGPARIKDATPAAGPGEHKNEFPKGNDSMQRQHCHSEEIGRSTKNLYKSIRRQILDCTAFVFFLLARHSPSAAFGSQGKKFFTSFRMTKGLIFGAQPAGHARRQPDVCGPPRGKAAARTAQKSRRTTQRHSYRNHCSHPPPHSFERLLQNACCGLPLP